MKCIDWERMGNFKHMLCKARVCVCVVYVNSSDVSRPTKARQWLVLLPSKRRFCPRWLV